jgi:hypothetical protein
MASLPADIKRDETYDNRVEDIAEKTSHSSGEIDSQDVELDESESARVLRKVDMRLVPILSLLYLVAFIDRSNSKLICVFYPACCRPR